MDDLSSAAASLPADIVRYKALGLPWTADQVLHSPETTKEDNAAIYLASSREKLESMDPWLGDPKAKLEEPFPSWAEPARLAPVLNLASIATTKSQAFYDYDFDQDSSASVTKGFEDLKDVVSILEYQATLASKKGNGAAAASYLSEAQHLTHLFASQPSWVTVSRVAESMMRICTAFETCLFSTFKNSAEFTKFVNGFHPEEVTVPVRLQLRAVTYSQISRARRFDLDPDVLRNPRQDQPPDIITPVRPDGVPDSIRQRAYLDRILRYWIEVELEFRKKLKGSNLATLADSIQSKYLGRGDSFAFLQRDFFSFENFYIRQNRIDGKVRAENVLVSALRYRAKHGVWPVGLAALSSLRDPFHGKPYMIKPVQNGAIVFSLADDSNSSPKTTLSFLNEKVHPYPPTSNVTAAFFPPPISGHSHGFLEF